MEKEIFLSAKMCENNYFVREKLVFHSFGEFIYI